MRNNWFKKYRRTQISELRFVTEFEVLDFMENSGVLIVKVEPSVSSVSMDGSHLTEVSISVEDLANGSPKIGDMIARNPKNHKDQWLVSEEYFNANFEQI